MPTMFTDQRVLEALMPDGFFEKPARATAKGLALLLPLLAASACGGPPTPARAGTHTPVLIAVPRQPPYPDTARAKGVEGTVSARCVITPEGKAADCKILNSVPELDQGVLDTLAQQRYAPATQNGEPIAAEHMFHFRFKRDTSMPIAALSDLEALELDLSPVPLLDPKAPKPTDSATGKALPFGAGMNRPTQVAGPIQPPYTRSALEHGVQGIVILRCVLTSKGTLNRCRTLKPLPYMTEIFVDSLLMRQYTPVLYEGRAVNVEYTFPFRFQLPDESTAADPSKPIRPLSEEPCEKGRVVARCAVDESGTLTNCSLTESTTDQATDQAVLAALYAQHPKVEDKGQGGNERTLPLRYRRGCVAPTP